MYERVAAKRLENVKNRIKKTAERVNRDPLDIKLIAVSKNHGIEKINYFKKNGIEIFGENRVQELLDKDEELKSNLNWHFIGHLQRNKVKYIMRMDNCLMIHSIDSKKLAREVNKRARKNDRVMPVLLEVNVSGDENKYGFTQEKALDFAMKINDYKNLDLRGLMTIVPYVDDVEEVRPYFKKLAVLKNDLNDKGLSLKELSMGMSNDFEVAIEEGATMVRVGTGLFGEREY